MADSPLTSNDEVPPVGSSETTRSRATFADLSEVDKITVRSCSLCDRQNCR